MLNKKRIHFSCFPKSKLFLFKLYDILNDKESNDIINWSSDDKSIIITNVNMLCNKVLPKYYKHTNYSSFVRQLNIYGFNKRKDLQKNKEGECYIHEKFNKNISKQQIMEITKQTKRIKLFSKLITIYVILTNNASRKHRNFKIFFLFLIIYYLISYLLYICHRM